MPKYGFRSRLPFITRSSGLVTEQYAVRRIGQSYGVVDVKASEVSDTDVEEPIDFDVLQCDIDALRALPLANGTWFTNAFGHPQFNFVPENPAERVFVTRAEYSQWQGYGSAEGFPSFVSAAPDTAERLLFVEFEAEEVGNETTQYPFFGGYSFSGASYDAVVNSDDNCPIVVRLSPMTTEQNSSIYAGMIGDAGVTLETRVSNGGDNPFVGVGYPNSAAAQSPPRVNFSTIDNSNPSAAEVTGDEDGFMSEFTASGAVYGYSAETPETGDRYYECYIGRVGEIPAWDGVLSAEVSVTIGDASQNTLVALSLPYRRIDDENFPKATFQLGTSAFYVQDVPIPVVGDPEGGTLGVYTSSDPALGSKVFLKVGVLEGWLTDVSAEAVSVTASFADGAWFQGLMQPITHSAVTFNPLIDSPCVVTPVAVIGLADGTPFEYPVAAQFGGGFLAQVPFNFVRSVELGLLIGFRVSVNGGPPFSLDAAPGEASFTYELPGSGVLPEELSVEILPSLNGKYVLGAVTTQTCQVVWDQLDAYLGFTGDQVQMVDFEGNDQGFINVNRNFTFLDASGGTATGVPVVATVTSSTGFGFRIFNSPDHPDGTLLGSGASIAIGPGGYTLLVSTADGHPVGEPVTLTIADPSAPWQLKDDALPPIQAYSSVTFLPS